jgi:hypothetical protein
MDTPRPQRDRIHIDVYLPHDQIERRIAAAVAAGGRVISDKNAPGWWTLADREGNEVDLATARARTPIPAAMACSSSAASTGSSAPPPCRRAPVAE